MSLTEPPNTGVALWRRVADSIEQAIADGTYPHDTRLPGELEIAEVHRVNRHTVRRALAALAERGLVRAERGSGTYVEAPRIAYPLRSRTRFSEIVGAGGQEADGKLLHSSIEAAPQDLAKRLGLKTGAPLLRDGRRQWVSYSAPELRDSDEFPALMTVFDATPAVRHGLIGSAQSRLIDMEALVAHATAHWQSER